MAATPLTPSASRGKNPSFPDLETLKPSSSLFLLKPSQIRFSRGKKQIRLELTSFENSHKWSSIDRVSETDGHHIVQSSISAVPMATNALDSTLPKNSKKVCLFYCAETKALAERVAAQSDSIELRNITWRTFEDGFPNLFISNAQGIRGQHVAFLASFSSPAVIFEQLSVIYALPKLFISSFTLVLPFFPTGTSERVEEEGDIATAFTLARILSNIPISRGGPTSLVIFDIHALQERFYFGDNVLPCFESGVPLLKNRLQQLPDSDNISIAFPDDGAWKRFYKQLQHFPMIICTKVREGDQRIVRLKEGDPRGRHVVIVDDLVQSGGTLIECQKVLAAQGAAKISAYVTHGIFPNRSWERFQHDTGGSPENGLTYFWITDSCPLTVKEVKNRRPFEVLSLAGAIAATLQI
ncbi:Phosphoribosyltransferase domain [Macleaya cordata]|uniref:ribose-phosphate diphosphokinase n=1 Tax=Macleaya cordata TaxID=56857 RepID=A0A200RDI8_MACCD|nr:Phosphoribosyltransferase domain [Macleaya cordata]